MKQCSPGKCLGTGPALSSRAGWVPSQQLHLVLVISVSFNDHVLTCVPLSQPGQAWPLGNNQQVTPLNNEV